jgi:hypothetical protein
MTSDILDKLTSQLDAGITSEMQVVYVLAGMRKIIERDGVRSSYRWLNFHCDWVLHPHLDRTDARAILNLFDAAHSQLRGSVKVQALPEPLRTEVTRISHMESFEAEFDEFCKAYGLPRLRAVPDGWSRFLHSYGKVIQDIPLTMSGGGTHVCDVVVDCATASPLRLSDGGEETMFNITWNIFDHASKYGEIFVVHSFRLRRS